MPGWSVDRGSRRPGLNSADVRAASLRKPDLEFPGRVSQKVRQAMRPVSWHLNQLGSRRAGEGER